MKSRYIVGLALAFLSVPVSFAIGPPPATNSWVGGSDKWETSGNWSAGTPTPGNAVDLITNATSKTVTIDALTPAISIAINNLVLSGPAGTVNTLQLTNAPSSTLDIFNSLNISKGGALLITNGMLLVGGPSSGSVSNSGTLTLIGGTTTFFSPLDIGGSAGATGTVWLSGGQLLATNNRTYVADAGVGRMTVSNGAWRAGLVVVGHAPGSSGTLTLIGGTNQFTDLMGVGGLETLPGETGAVWVTGGQLVTTNGGVDVGATGVGQMTLSNAVWLVDALEVGSFGNTPTGASGTLTMVGSTVTVSSTFAVGAADPTATGAVWLTSGQLTDTNGFSYVGWHGVGQMTVSNGTWRAGNMIVGYWPGSQGTLTIAGGTNIFFSVLDIGAQPGATGAVWLTGGQLIVTNSLVLISEGGSGQLTVSNGTFLAGALVFADPGTAHGTLTVAGGTATILGDFNAVNGTQTVWLTGGQLNVIKGATTLGDLGVARMTVSNGLWRARNVIIGNAPGSQGTLTIAGGVSSVYSNVTIGSTNCTASSVVLITGGELHVTNDAVTAMLEVQNGTVIQSGGVLDVDRLVITNPCAHFIHTGGTLIYGLVTLSPDLDADGDGMANSFEQANGLDPFDPTDATKDNDGDGQNNLTEFLAGTDPNDRASVFRIVGISRLGDAITVIWTGGRGVTNVIEHSIGGPGGSYSTNGYSTVVTTYSSGSGLITNSYSENVEVPITPSLFYRVRGIR